MCSIHAGEQPQPANLPELAMATRFRHRWRGLSLRTGPSAAPMAPLDVIRAMACWTLYFLCVSPVISPTLSFARAARPVIASTCAFWTISVSCFMSATILCHAF